MSNGKCLPCEAEKRKSLNKQKYELIEKAIKDAKEQGKEEIAIVQSLNGISWMARDASEPNLSRFPEVEYIRIL